MNVALLAEDGSSAGNVELLDAIFAAKVNIPLMHQVVTAQLAAARRGTHSTKTRAEVRGGGIKPWRQKGTGRARHGSTREPQWKGGGTTFGPKPRSYAQDTPKKMKAAALRSALTDRASEGRILVVNSIDFGDTPRTKRAVAALGAWKADGRFLLILGRDEDTTAFAFRNLPKGHLLTQDQLNVYDVMASDVVVFTKSALDEFQERADPNRSKGDDVVAQAATPSTNEPGLEVAPAGSAEEES